MKSKEYIYLFLVFFSHKSNKVKRCIASLFAIVSTDGKKKTGKNKSVCNVTLCGLSLDTSYFFLVKHTYFSKRYSAVPLITTSSHYRGVDSLKGWTVSMGQAVRRGYQGNAAMRIAMHADTRPSHHRARSHIRHQVN